MSRTVAVLLLVALPLFAIEPPRERERWAALTVDEFTILGNAPDRELRDIANRVIRLRDSLGLVTNLRVRSPLPTRIYVFNDERSFIPYRDAAMGRATEHTGGIFLPRAEGSYVLLYIGKNTDADHIVQHELAHHFLRNTVGRGVPLWFSEGLAEFYSTFTIEGDSIKVGLPEPMHVDLLREGHFIPMAELLAMDEHSTAYNEGSRRGMFYAQSWALVHELVLGNAERRKQVGTFLGLIADGVPGDMAFHEAFNVTPEQMERELRSYIRAYSLKYARFRASDLGKLVEAPAPAAMPRDEILAALGDLLLHTTPAAHADGQAFVEAALRLNPKNGAATASLGLAKLLARKRAESDALYETAVQLGVKEWLPYAIVGDRLAGRGKPLEARTFYERAAKLNPDAPHAWAGIGMTYVGAEGDVKPGIAALERSLKLDASQEDAAANLAQLYIREGRRDEARKLLDTAPLADDLTASRVVRDALLADDARDAVELIRKGKEAEGTEALTKIVPQIHDPTLRAQIEKALTTVQEATQEEQQIRELNRARSFAVNRQWKEALEIVDRLLPAIHDASLREQVVAFRKQVAKMSGR
jgi:tetratricopeptide (TPR) repeat protein